MYHTQPCGGWLTPDLTRGQRTRALPPSLGTDAPTDHSHPQRPPSEPGINDLRSPSVPPTHRPTAPSLSLPMHYPMPDPPTGSLRVRTSQTWAMPAPRSPSQPPYTAPRCATTFHPHGSAATHSVNLSAPGPAAPPSRSDMHATTRHHSLRARDPRPTTTASWPWNLDATSIQRSTTRHCRWLSTEPCRRHPPWPGGSG